MRFHCVSIEINIPLTLHGYYVINLASIITRRATLHFIAKHSYIYKTLVTLLQPILCDDHKITLSHASN